MTTRDLSERFVPILNQMAEQSNIAGSFINKDSYQIFLTTLWSNLVLNPEDAGLSVDDLEECYEVINERAIEVLGGESPIKEAFAFLATTDGEKAMTNARLSKNHRDLLTYFASMILDPEGHKKWMERVRD